MIFPIGREECADAPSETEWTRKSKLQPPEICLIVLGIELKLLSALSEHRQRSYIVPHFENRANQHSVKSFVSIHLPHDPKPILSKRSVLKNYRTSREQQLHAFHRA